MTTIGSTSYYATTNRYTGSDRSSGVGDATGSQTKDNKAPSPTQYSAESAIDGRPSSSSVSLQGKLFSLTGIVHKGSETLKGIPTWEMPDDFYQSVVSGMQMSLEANYRVMPEEPDLTNDPRMGAYATVVVAGKIVATIDNQGVVGSDDVLGAKLRDSLPGDVNGTNGPNLAQARAEQIANFLGGRIVKSDAAITQSAFNALPSWEASKPTVDYEAMKNDPMYEQLEALKQKRAEYLGQQE